MAIVGVGCAVAETAATGGLGFWNDGMAISAADDYVTEKLKSMVE